MSAEESPAARTRIKICGCTSVRDVLGAVAAGADAVGVILAETSPRRVTPAAFEELTACVPAFVSLVAVFVDAQPPLVRRAVELGATPQFHGKEDAVWCEAVAPGSYIKAYHVRDGAPVDPAAFAAQSRPYAHATWLFDTAREDGRSGGSGRTFRWDTARELAGSRPFVVSGGLTPDNVGACVRAVRPYAVDVRSGVETAGAKDPAKMRAFVDAVRAADADVR